ncbi:MAG: YdaS family helix-turn-helix protein [Thalassolituus sp.]|jgi:DNA-binding transcriptional regulator YdaS (Cro superfamily)
MADTIESITEKVTAQLGGQAGLGRSLGVKQQVVGYWVTKKGRIPAEHVLHVERLLVEAGSGIDRYDLRPDVYGERPVSVNDASSSAA